MTKNDNRHQLQTIKTKVALLCEIEEALIAIHGDQFQKEFATLVNDGFTLEQIKKMLQNQSNPHTTEL